MSDDEKMAREIMREKVLAGMLRDAQKITDVAEVVSLNRSACAALVQANVSEEMDDVAAMGFVRIMFDVLSELAHDMKEAAELVESGKADARIASIIPLDDPTKH